MILAFFSGGEILLIFLVVLLLFGAKRLPEIARSMGKAMNEFKKAKDEIVTTAEEPVKPPPAAPAAPTTPVPNKPATPDEPNKPDSAASQH